VVAVATPAPPPVPPKAAEPDLIKQAEEASKRGNDAESAALYRKAANEGIVEAQYRLGEIYAAGRGVNQSNFQAYVWFSLAAGAGHGGAKTRRDQVVTSLQPAEIQQADRVIRERLKAAVQRKG
jgi:TPR repeat protein